MQHAVRITSLTQVLGHEKKRKEKTREKRKGHWKRRPKTEKESAYFHYRTPRWCWEHGFASWSAAAVSKYLTKLVSLQELQTK